MKKRFKIVYITLCATTNALVAAVYEWLAHAAWSMVCIGTDSQQLLHILQQKY